MKNILYILMLFLFTSYAHAQKDMKFDPEKFNQEQEAYIIKEARLNPQEVKLFLPVFRELKQKQRSIYTEIRKCIKPRLQNDKEAEKLITKRDQLEMQMKKLQSSYHSKLCKILPATKVYYCIQAEERFKHHIMEKMSKRKPHNK